MGSSLSPGAWPAGAATTGHRAFLNRGPEIEYGYRREQEDPELRARAPGCRVTPASAADGTASSVGREGDTPDARCTLLWTTCADIAAELGAAGGASAGIAAKSCPLGDCYQPERHPLPVRKKSAIEPPAHPQMQISYPQVTCL